MLFREWTKEKEQDDTLPRKKREDQDSVTITISMDGKQTIFPVNCLNNDIKNRIFKKYLVLKNIQFN